MVCRGVSATWCVGVCLQYGRCVGVCLQHGRWSTYVLYLSTYLCVCLQYVCMTCLGTDPILFGRPILGTDISTQKCSGYLQCVCGMLVRGMSGTCLGHVWGMSGACLGHVWDV